MEMKLLLFTCNKHHNTTFQQHENEIKISILVENHVTIFSIVNAHPNKWQQTQLKRKVQF